MDKQVDPRRKEKVVRYKPPESQGGNPQADDPMPDYMNILGKNREIQFQDGCF